MTRASFLQSLLIAPLAGLFAKKAVPLLVRPTGSMVRLTETYGTFTGHTTTPNWFKQACDDFFLSSFDQPVKKA